MIDPNLDPEIETQLRSFLASSADLATATIQLENLSLDDIVPPIRVDENYMSLLASAPSASASLQQYAAQVAAGYCTWPEIEYRLAAGLPPEVVELKSSPKYVWQWGVSEPDSSAPTANPAGPASAHTEPPAQRLDRRRRAEPETVGPSDWPDEFDEYPTQRNWLV
ncbi:hypothetical protein IU448_21185 [Nocardia flavorosea]|uniref:hypothetical protein n=1 Tax=Nocardia flavorosea TaxID=53429 RepID=UPI001894B349|nr:hypothetical protein [Nocardia flavorosea]MBF6351505.1 hypothetical protein [Nocardia flavorosea]